MNISDLVDSIKRDHSSPLEEMNYEGVKSPLSSLLLSKSQAGDPITSLALVLSAEKCVMCN